MLCMRLARTSRKCSAEPFRLGIHRLKGGTLSPFRFGSLLEPRGSVRSRVFSFVWSGIEEKGETDRRETL